MKATIDNIRHLISEGKLGEAIDQLRELSPRLTSKQLRDEIILISSSQRTLDMERRANISSADQISQEKNRLTRHILELLAELETDTPNDRTATVPSGYRPHQRKNEEGKNKLLPILLGVIVVILAGSLLWVLGGNNDEPRDTLQDDLSTVTADPSPIQSPVNEDTAPDPVPESKPPPPPPPAKPDLSIARLTMNPSVPVQGEEVSFQAVITNKGAGNAGPFDLAWYGGDNFATPNYQERIEGLAAGGSKTVNFQYAGYKSWYGTISSRLVLDEGQLVKEDNEDNNVERLTHAVTKPARAVTPPVSPPTVARGADLVVARFQMKPTTPKKGEKVFMQAILANRGTTDAGAFNVAWYGGDNFKTPGYKTKISGLKAGETKVISFQYAGYSSWYGKITSRLEIDSDNTVRESDERNNAHKTTHAVSQ